MEISLTLQNLTYDHKKTTHCNVSSLPESTEAVARRCSVKKVLLKISQNSQENNCVRIFFLIKLQAEAYNFIKKGTLTQVFYYEFWEIFKNTFFDRTPLVAASESRSLICQTRMFERHEPNICNVVCRFIWHQNSFLENIPLNKLS